jgi:hypothetical protein
MEYITKKKPLFESFIVSKVAEIAKSLVDSIENPRKFKFTNEGIGEEC